MIRLLLLLAGAALAYAVRRGPEKFVPARPQNLLETGAAHDGVQAAARPIPMPSTADRISFLGLVTLGTAATIAILPPIPQFEKYHDFADKRRILGIPYFTNVVSNIAFVIAGLRGLRFVLREARIGADGAFAESNERWPFAGMFLGSLLVGLGSGYYHLAPNNPRLAWDRWPMAITFTSFLDTVINDRISPRAARSIYLPLLLLGIASVSYWRATERRGHSDLRPYGFVHFGSSLLVPLILGLFPSRYKNGQDQWKVLGLYSAAMGGEVLDKPVYALGHLVSGHSLKHVFGAMAVEREHQMLRSRHA